MIDLICVLAQHVESFQLKENKNIPINDDSAREVAEGY